MTPALPSTVCLQLLALLAVEVGVIALVAMSLQHWIRSVAWRRTLWQIAIVSVLGIVGSELSGSARGLAGWVLSVTGRHNISAATPGLPVGIYDSASAVPLRFQPGFRAPVETQTAGNKVAPIFSSIGAPSAPAAPVQPVPALVLTPPKIAEKRAAPVSPRFADTTLVAWLIPIWLAGSVLVAGRLVLACCAFVIFRRRRSVVTDPVLLQRITGLARVLRINRRVRAVQSGRLTSPIAFGLVQPTVALPLDFTTRFDGAQQEAMLAHELAHLAAGDSFWYWLADAGTIVLWWHPAVWWLRHQLRAASESAADEASLLVADGPRVLAECLVELGGRLVRSQPGGGLGVEGFRSHLGRRVQRLIHLDGHTWSPPRRPQAALARSFGPMALVTVVILCSAWVAPRALTKGENMKTLQQSWKQSLAMLALVTAFNSTHAGLAADVPAKPTAVPDARPSAAVVLAAANESAGPRVGVGEPVIPRGELGGSNRTAPLEAKLRGIVLEVAYFDGLPLPEVLKSLNEEALKRDPEKRGINFLINPNAPLSSVGMPPNVDPTTGLPGPSPSVEAVDPSSIQIKFNLPLRNVTMKDLLDAIVKVADKPVAYSLEDYGVVFSLSPEARTVMPALPLVLGARTFKVDTNTFVAGLQSAFGIKIESLPANDTVARSRKIQSALRELLTQLGVSLEGNKSVFYNELTGIVMVRGIEQDLDVVTAAMETLGGSVISTLGGPGSGAH